MPIITRMSVSRYKYRHPKHIHSSTMWSHECILLHPFGPMSIHCPAHVVPRVYIAPPMWSHECKEAQTSCFHCSNMKKLCEWGTFSIYVKLACSCTKQYVCGVLLNWKLHIMCCDRASNSGPLRIN